MSDDEILALANAVSTAMRDLSAIRAKFGTDSDTYTAQYQEWDRQRGIVSDAERALAAARDALDAGLASR